MNPQDQTPLCRFCETALAVAGEKYCAECQELGDRALDEILGDSGLFEDENHVEA